MAAEFLLPYLFQHGGLTIDENDYFGDIDSLQAEAKCCNTGYYLVRRSAEQNNYFLTVNWKGKGIHIPIQKMFNVSLVSICCLSYHAYKCMHEFSSIFTHTAST